MFTKEMTIFFIYSELGWPSEVSSSHICSCQAWSRMKPNSAVLVVAPAVGTILHCSLRLMSRLLVPMVLLPLSQAVPDRGSNVFNILGGKSKPRDCLRVIPINLVEVSVGIRLWLLRQDRNGEDSCLVPMSLCL
jgi:hypothetical protein